MRRIYDLKLVYDYIWGNDIENYNVEDLENDPDFMLQVMERSKDKKIYELCSESVKNDYGFVREVVELFKNDLEFVTEVADTYLDSLDEGERIHDLPYTELNIIMSDLYGEVFNNFAVISSFFYEYERRRAKACIDAFDDELMKDESKAGFVITAVQYEESPIIVDFVARRMFNSALYDARDNNLEYLIHSRFKSLEEFKSYGEVQFLRDCIDDYDRRLGLYAFEQKLSSSFENVLARALKEVRYVENSWSMYMDRVNSWRVDVFEHEMFEFMLDSGYSGSLSYDDVISYVANKLGVVDVFKKFDPEFEFSYDREKYKIVDTTDVQSLNKATELATRLFSVDVIDDSYDDYVDDDFAENLTEQDDLSGKIVRFKLADEASIRIRK